MDDYGKKEYESGEDDANARRLTHEFLTQKFSGNIKFIRAETVENTPLHMMGKFDLEYLLFGKITQFECEMKDKEFWGFGEDKDLLFLRENNVVEIPFVFKDYDIRSRKFEKTTSEFFTCFSTCEKFGCFFSSHVLRENAHRLYGKYCKNNKKKTKEGFVPIPVTKCTWIAKENEEWVTKWSPKCLNAPK